MWETAHYCCTTCGIGSGDFLPDDGAHVIKANCFTKFDYFRSDGDYLVTAIVNRTSKLVANVNAKPASRL